VNSPVRLQFFHSTIGNFIVVLIAAFCVSTIFFTGLSKISDTVISNYMWNTHYVEKETIRVIHSLQEFVKDKRISSDALERIGDWKKNEKYVRLIMFNGTERIYDSDFPKANPSEIDDRNGVTYAPNHTISLEDGTIPAYLECFFEYRFFELATVIQLIISFIVFTSIVIIFTGKHLSYINQIVFGVGILEGGNLDYEIPIHGDDELTALATSLNEMRKAFIKKNEKPKSSTKAGIENLSAISHDLRTPLTTLILFIEIIKTKKTLTDEERDHYIQKISVIANKIRLLSENLEDFTSEKNPYSVLLDEPQPIASILDEVLSEALVFLKERGFHISKKILIKDEKVQVNSHCIYRIVDNIVSNINRYAAPCHPVVITVKRHRDTVSLSFLNSINPANNSMATSKLGLSLVNEMMRKMGGSCETSIRANQFEIKLTFPVIS